MRCPSAPIAGTHRDAAARWRTCCGWATPGCRRCSTTGSRASTPPTRWTTALAARAQLTHGEVIMTREGHAVSAARGRASTRPIPSRPGCWRARRRSRTSTGGSARRRCIADDARARLGAAGGRLHRRARPRSPPARREAAEAQNARARAARRAAAAVRSRPTPRAQRREPARRRARRDRRAAGGARGAPRHRRGALRGTRRPARRRRSSATPSWTTR
ncbi:MAG: hypothetical protein MZW92_55920 [Comamonadaceae bacterium]|nr:hypothetical protein [Comamonadaceae bacterium]